MSNDDTQQHPGDSVGDVTLTPKQHRALGVSLFNRTWELMDLEDRTPDQEDDLLATAYASLYHWKQVGTPANSSRGEWQVSRVYTVLGRAEPALHHARRCLEICTANGIVDWDLAYAYESLARASVTAGDVDAANGYLTRARAAAEQIADPEDRQHVEEDLATITP